MDNENIEALCENAMNVVVESRKRFGKMSVDYEKKRWLMENKILNLKVETISNCRFKPKHAIPASNTEDLKQTDDFINEFSERQSRIENLKVKLKDTQTMVLQLKKDNVFKELKRPLTAEAMLNDGKRKHLS